MAYTIRQLAEKIGVSKPAIEKHIRELGIRDNLTMQGNKLLISNADAEVIIESFRSKKKKDRKQPQATAKDETQGDMILFLQEQLREKDRQLAEKDEQIKGLQFIMNNLTSLPAPTERNIVDVPQETESEQHQRKSLFGKIFG